jgi:hypothetical protein
VGGRIRPERQVVPFGAGAQRVQDHAGLDARNPLLDIDLENPIHVFGEVEDDGDVAALAGEARTGTAGEDRRERRGAAHAHRPHPSARRRRWHLSIVGGIGGVQRPAALIEAHFAAHAPPELVGELGGTRETVDRLRVGARRKRCGSR